MHCRCFAAVLLLVCFVAPAPGQPRRNADVDLIKIATRFVERYSTVSHKAGDADGMFIEDVVIPSVASVAHGYGARIPDAVRRNLYPFLLAGEPFASEELAELAGHLYTTSPVRFCNDISTFSSADQRRLTEQARAGIASKHGQAGDRPLCR